MQVEGSSEIMVLTYQTTKNNIPEDKSSIISAMKT